jgi:hypothetical protein
LRYFNVVCECVVKLIVSVQLNLNSLSERIKNKEKRSKQTNIEAKKGKNKGRKGKMKEMTLKMYKRQTNVNFAFSSHNPLSKENKKPTKKPK